MPKGSYRPNCSHSGCSRPHAAKGYCTKHYQRWRKCGDPDGEGLRIVQEGRDLADRFTKKFLRGIRVLENGCWASETSYKGVHGYSELQISENNVQHSYRTHIFSYMHFRGNIPKGMLVCHKCDNRYCCNPDHLFLGTPSENSQDMVRKGRGLVGEKNPNTKFKEQDVLNIYADLDRGMLRSQIAQKYGVKSETICHIANGRNWRHLYQRHRANKSV